jgi:hypothetical protein
MRKYIAFLTAPALVGIVCATATLGADAKKPDVLAGWTHDFTAEKVDLVSSGRNPYFVLEPGYELVLKNGNEVLTITVKDETKTVDGVETRIVEEKETKDGELVEISRNFYAISKRTNSVYYFGEEVDIYENGKVVNHDGAWLAGEKGATFGLMMQGLPLIGSKHYQEVAPGEAMDRAETLSVSETVKTPAGEFKSCLKVEETTPLEPKEVAHKHYAPGIGLVQDGKMHLVKHGKVGD